MYILYVAGRRSSNRQGDRNSAHKLRGDFPYEEGRLPFFMSSKSFDHMKRKKGLY